MTSQFFAQWIVAAVALTTTSCANAGGKEELKTPTPTESKSSTLISGSKVNLTAPTASSGAEESASLVNTPDVVQERGSLEEAIGAKGEKSVHAIGASGKTRRAKVRRNVAKTKKAQKSAKVSMHEGAKAHPKPKAVTLKETENYLLVANVPSKADVGAPGEVVITITPKPGWKLNQKFPTKLKMSAPEDVKLAKETQTSKDANRFSEKVGVFDVKFTPSASGEKEFSGNFRFSVCTPASCVSKSEDFGWKLAVK